MVYLRNMKIGRETIGQQGNLDLTHPETEDERKKRLIEDIRRKQREGDESRTAEELEYIRNEISELDDNPHQSKGSTH